MFVGSAFELNFLPSKLCFSLKSNFEFIFPGTEANPHSMDRRLFSALYCGPKMNLHANRPFFVFFFFLSGSRNNAKYAFQYLFKIKTGQYGKRKKRKNKAGAFTTGYLRRITHPNPCQRLLSLGNRQNTTGYTTLNAQFTGNVLPFVMLLEI